MEIVWLAIADSPELWRDNGFTVDDEGRCLIDGVEHRLVGPTDDGASGVVGWGVSGIDGEIDSIDGIPTTVEVAPSTPPASPEALPTHANGVFRIDHLVIRTSNTPRTVAALEALGGERRGGRDTNSAGEAVDMTFFWAGDTLLELAGPPEPKNDGKPARLAGIAYSTDDLEATVELLGHKSTDPVDAVQPGRRIAALRKEAGSSVPTAFMTPHR